ncbi:2-amino-4-hydroxy-6-hydroxymethyldihydropteridine diphosphokinase [Candidatus Peregrinibacteria bacterium]|nr:2-amino-4-hydroxy-6-hydroxymethyldihydropteridine diphosphokinase [Candidatus Peregrinibacteria bacterium]
MIYTAYFSLGSNIGRRKDNLKHALKLLDECGIEITKKSLLYETKAISKIKQRDFFNICIEAKTEIAPDKLLKICKSIEKQMGRKPHKTNKNGFYEPRIIDIDILLYGQKIIRKRNLIIPHKNMHMRRFVLEPLNEIDPYINHPVLHKSVKELLNECQDKSEVTRHL